MVGMRKFILILSVLLLLSQECFAYDIGEVMLYDENNIIIRTDYGYTCGSLIIIDYANSTIGASIYQGDFIVGEFYSYGMSEMYDKTTGVSFSCFIDEYGLSGESALAWARAHCF